MKIIHIMGSIIWLYQFGNYSFLNAIKINDNRSVDDSDGRKRDWDASLTTWLKLSVSDTVSARQVWFFTGSSSRNVVWCLLTILIVSQICSAGHEAREKKIVHERLLASPCITSGLRIIKSDGPRVFVLDANWKNTHRHGTAARVFCLVQQIPQ